MTTTQVVRVLSGLIALAVADDGGIAKAIGSQAYELLSQATTELRRRHLGVDDTYSFGCSTCEALRAAESLLAEVEP